MLPFKEIVYTQRKKSDFTALLAADIGGTNSNFGIFSLDDNQLTMILSLHIKSALITNFTNVVLDLLEYLKKEHRITVHEAIFAAAGVISDQRLYSKPTNLSFGIDIVELKEKTGLSTIMLANDFEVIGYGLALLKPEDLVTINEGIAHPHANKAIIGAGTGLGKSILFWHKEYQRYVPILSEGGHADFSAQNQEEMDLIIFLHEECGCHCAISWEDLLSGLGIQRIYNFFKSREKKMVDLSLQQSPHPDEIFNSRFNDQSSWRTFALYTKLYARCAKNFMLDTLALGGIYIAGGIAAKNVPLFQLPDFMAEFINCGKHQSLLAQTPIKVILDYNISLYGAARYAALEKNK